MPASKTPVGSVPETKVEAASKDVKQETVANASEPTESLEAQSSEESSPELDESDLKEVQEGQKVPYSRFKEVNDRAKQAQRELEMANERYQTQLAQKMAELEAVKTFNAQKPQDNGEEILDLTYEDPGSSKVIKQLMNEITSLKGEVSGLKHKTSQESLQSKVKEVKAKFPDSDELAIMGILKHNPGLDPEEVAETLQKNVDAKVEKRLKEIIERKKMKQKNASLPLSETGFRLKESERPKTVKEASSKLKSLLGKLPSF